MNLTVLALLALALLAIWLLIRIRRGYGQSEVDPTPVAKAGESQFHAVSIKITGTACDAAKAMTGRRFLSAAAPKLPLPDCDVLECNCRFVHHKDRRSGKDRRSPFSPAGFGGGTGSFERDKRQVKDRRQQKSDEDYL